MSKDAYERITLPAVAAVLAQKQALAIEEACERSLTDPQQRGVAVHRYLDGRFEVGLSPSVPYGEIHEWNEGAS